MSRPKQEVSASRVGFAGSQARASLTTWKLPSPRRVRLPYPAEHEPGADDIAELDLVFSRGNDDDPDACAWVTTRRWVTRFGRSGRPERVGAHGLRCLRRVVRDNVALIPLPDE
jgi:hypothetical protein